MGENKHTIGDLYQMQSLPLSAKIRMTERRIIDWIDYYGENGVYVSFSGGKDSTVLMDIVRNRLGYKNVPAVFVDVPTQFPELKEFALTWDNVEVLRPKISFMQVCEKYGFPLISKDVSEIVSGARKYLMEFMKREGIVIDRQKNYVPFARYMALLMGIRESSDNKVECTQKVEKIMNEAMIITESKMPYSYEMQRLIGVTGSDKENAELRDQIKTGYKYGLPSRLLILAGKLPHKENGRITKEASSMYNQSKYLFMLDAPFEVSNMCCKVMKKDPVHKYAKETGRVPITGQMASESKLRAQQWMKNGCNGFDMKSPISNPMSFWTDQDVLLYIKQNNLPICSVYGDVVEDVSGTNDVEGQLTISDLEGYEHIKLFDAERPPLKTTGCRRTGCALCGFGCHMDKPGQGRFTLLKQTHPGMYNLLDVIKNNGVTFREAIEWMNEHGNLNIRL